MLFPARRKLFKGFTLISAGRLATTSQWRSSDIRRNAGFTLIELLVVIAIIGTIIGGVFVAFTNAQQKGRDQRRKEDLQSLKTALTAYYLDHGSYPPGNYGF